MQWILQDFEDTRRLGAVLEQKGLPFSWHKVVPFVGELQPDPGIADPTKVILFGAYTLWRYAEKNGLAPGVFRIKPFVHEREWQPFMLNGADALFAEVRDLPTLLEDDGRSWFMRPVSDGKEEPGRVRKSGEILDLARKVLSLAPDEIIGGALTHETELMLTTPAKITAEWRLWVVNDVIVTYSLYKEGHRVVYRPEIDDDALEFAKHLIDLNPGYSPAFVMDICRTPFGLRLLETNCLNAAGFYAANLASIVEALENL